MRGSARSALAAAALIAAAALLLTDRAIGEAGDGGDDERVYVARGSEVRYRAVHAPLPARRLGQIAVASVDGLREGGETGAALSVLGEGPADVPPPGWPDTAVAGDAGKLPLGALPARGRRSCKCATRIGDEAAERVAAVYASRSFTVGAERKELRMLRLRVRFRDGLIAHINGREVARRNLPTGVGPMGVAERPRGPEWETFYIPVTDGLLRRGDNLLAIEVRPSGQRLSPTLDFELVGDTGGARLVRGPMVQRVDTDSAVIVFDTDVPARAAVEWGPTPELGQRVESAGGALAARHVVALEGLPAAAAVHYRVVTDGDVSETVSLHTAPEPGDVVRFAVYGDVRGGHRVHGQLVEALLSEAPDFIIATGDMVLRGSDEGDWQRFFEVTAELLPRVPYYPAVGNHDMGLSGDERRRMNDIFELWPGPPERPIWGHWYSFELGGVHFVMLDSNSYEHAEQLEWLERDLTAARERGVRAIFAATHDGPYSRGLHRGNRRAAKDYAPVLAEHGVAMIFSGHDHLYQRGEVDGLRYIVSGGGGAPLYPITCGVSGRPRCKVDDGMQHVAREYHYVMITVYPEHMEVCPKRRDRSPLEACIKYRLGE